MKTLLIISGISGSGKSTLAETLIKRATHFDQSIEDDFCGSIICTADDYFMVDGEYKFDSSKLGEAHKACIQKCEDSMQVELELIIVANTTTDKKSAKPYLDMAKQYGYNTHWTITVPHHSGTNQHDVPHIVLSRQASNLQDTLEEVHKEFLR